MTRQNQWSADERTRQAIAAVLAGNEEDTVVTTTVG
jgi:hypothetical protein